MDYGLWLVVYCFWKTVMRLQAQQPVDTVADKARMLLRGKMITAAEALDYGLVAEVYDDIATLREKEEELALELAAKAPITMKLDKRLVYDAAGKQPTDIAQRDAMTLGFLFTTRDAREGLRAFLEKRKPVYENR